MQTKKLQSFLLIPDPNRTIEIRIKHVPINPRFRRENILQIFIFALLNSDFEIQIHYESGIISRTLAPVCESKENLEGETGSGENVSFVFFEI